MDQPQERPLRCLSISPAPERLQCILLHGHEGAHYADSPTAVYWQLGVLDMQRQEQPARQRKTRRGK